MSLPYTRIILVFVFCLILTGQTAFAGGSDVVWRPVTPEELQMKTPKVEADADAEAIFWEVRLDNKDAEKISYNHYIRVKIFTERGRERFSKFDIPFTKGKKVEDVAARVIKPDGSIVELKPEDVFEREIIKSGHIKIKAKSFAVPGIEPGAIIEYQYKEVFKNDSADGERLVFQRDIPLQKVTYYVRPYSGSTLSYHFYNMPETRFSDEKKGYSVATLTNVPAYKEEPYMPPDDEVRRWVLLSYDNLGSLFSWQLLSYGLGQYVKDLTKPNKEIKQKAAELTAGAATDDEKLRKIYEFAHHQIKNISYDSSYTEEQRKDLKLKNAGDAIKAGVGTSEYIDLLFASLAKAAGYETDLVMSGDRSENFFSPEKYTNRSFIHPACIAVKVGEEWQYFNPGTPYLPYRKLVWNEEGVIGMLIGDKGGVSWQMSPMMPPAESPAKRTGRFKLLEDGTLEGTARVEYGGQQAITRRREGYMDSTAKREEAAKNEIKSHISTAEISDVKVENFTDDNLPLTYSYKIRVPNYAQKTGKRLFLQPGFFEYGVSPVFSSATRTNSIYFPYPWSENDDIEITMPKTFALDNADAPGKIADQNKIALLDVSISVNAAEHKLVYKRAFFFGGESNILFPASAYQQIKKFFDAFHSSDSHTITLKQTSN